MHLRESRELRHGRDLEKVVDVLNRVDAAEQLHVPPRQLRRHLGEGQLEEVHVGRQHGSQVSGHQLLHASDVSQVVPGEGFVHPPFSKS